MVKGVLYNKNVFYLLSVIAAFCIYLDKYLKLSAYVM